MLKIYLLYFSPPEKILWLDNEHIKAWQMGLTCLAKGRRCGLWDKVQVTSWHAVFIPCRECISFKKESIPVTLMNTIGKTT